MRLELTNIGKIAHADIALEGVTVIAGPNNTGKSTIGKSLFGVIDSYVDLNNLVKSELIESVSTAILDASKLTWDQLSSVR